ncbi:MAG: DUF167 domain-containing protein [Spirochaetia bacterium]|nr:MAG: DUF167 domain-containing protein [Spirochaetia bacterium]
MKIFVKAKPTAKEEKIQKIDETHYAVSVKEPPVNGKANAAIIKALAKYFNISPSRINILSGQTSKQKIVEIL